MTGDPTRAFWTTVMCAVLSQIINPSSLATESFIERVKFLFPKILNKQNLKEIYVILFRSRPTIKHYYCSSNIETPESDKSLFSVLSLPFLSLSLSLVKRIFLFTLFITVMSLILLFQHINRYFHVFSLWRKRLSNSNFFIYFYYIIYALWFILLVWWISFPICFKQ